MNQLTIVFPGLLGPFSSLDWQSVPVPYCPNLQRLLRRGDEISIVDDCLERTLYQLFYACAEPNQELPIGAIARLGDTGNTSDSWCFRVEPVHFYADGDRVLLTDGSALSITENEAKELIAQFNELFAQDGLELAFTHPLRWYLTVSNPANVSSRCLWEVVGRTIDPFLPIGPDANHWRKILTEVQMLFHAHPCNEQRATAGLLSINGIWIWGGGRLPAVMPAYWTKIYSDDVYIQGLARLSECPCVSVPDSLASWLEGQDIRGRHLLVFENQYPAVVHGDLPKWKDLLEKYESDWFKPLLHALHHKRLNEVILHFGNHKSYQVRRSNLRRFWRKDQALSNFLHGS